MRRRAQRLHGDGAPRRRAARSLRAPAPLGFERLESRLPLAAHFVISELLADNEGAALDNYGVASDFVEIHNDGDAAGSLAGYYLTDDDDDEPTRWQFPAVVVPAGGYVVVWASGRDERTLGQPLHGNFSLANEGEYLALLAPDGTTVVDAFAPQFPPQRNDISYGLGQIVDAVTYVAPGAAAQTLVPTSAADDATWMAPGYVPGGSWTSGETGVGFGQTFAGFLVRTYQANIAAGSPIGTTLDNIDEVLELIGNPAAYTSVSAGNHATFNLFNTGGDGFYATGNAAFPGQTNPTNYQHFATEAHARVTIPSAGAWTFGVHSNEGFLLQVGDFEMTRNGTGNGPQLATFTFDAPGTYDLDLYHFERTGDAWIELFAAPGTHASWNAGSFRLVGDVAGGGLAVTSNLVGSTGASIAELLGTNLQTPMFGSRTSFYTRVPFNVASPAAYDQLKLRVKYDDAFVAYLNGMEVARRNFAGTPAWNSTAGSPRTGDEPLIYEEIDISAFLGSLTAGPNLLAMHGMNAAASDPDLLVLPELVAVDAQSAGLAYFTTPTPGAPNGSGFVDFVADPQFSVERGFYDAPFQVALTSATPETQIYFTTNGDVPTQGAGTLYAGPINVSGTTTLRAAAFRSGYLPATVVTQTYLFLNDIVRQNQAATIARGLPATWGSLTPDYGMDPDVIGNFDAAGNTIGGDLYGGQYAATIKNDLKSIPTMSIVLDVDDMFGPSGIYTNSTQRGAAWERAASVEWIDDNGTLEFQVNAGIRVQGGAFRSDGLTKKHSLRLLFKNEYGPGKLDYPIFGDDEGIADQFNTIVLRAGANDGYAWNSARYTEQYIRDQFGRSLQGATGQPASHGTFVHLYINGVYWGLHNPVERPDAEFQASYFGGDPENWDVIHVDETPDGDDAAWNAMFAQAAQAGSSLAAYMELQGKNLDGTRNPAIAPLLDVESYVDYIALNVWGGNWDWPRKNYWAGRDRDPATTTGFQFFTWDFENTMGNNRARSPLEATALDQVFTGARNAGQPHASLAANAEYRLLFADHVHKLYFNNGILTPDRLVERYIPIADEVERAMVAESARWGDTHFSTAPLTLADWTTERDWILNAYLPQRSAIVMQELKSYSLYPNVVAPAFSQHGGQVTPGFDVAVTAPAGQIWYTRDGSDPRLIGGAVNPGAMLAGAMPVDIPEGLTLKARVLSGGAWSALNEATFSVAVPAGAGNLRIVELHYNPADQPGVADAQDLEFIELLNPSGQPVSLDGVTITQFANAPYAFPSGLVLGPGERIVVARSPAVFQATYGAGINVAPLGYFDANLSNGGEQIALVGPLGQSLQDFTFDDVGGWPTAADGGGQSLEIVDPLGDPSSAANWRASFYRGGSPGADGLPPATPGDFDGDGTADGGDFLAWQRGLGTPQLQGAAAHGDADGDRDVDAADLALWADSFGATPAFAAAAAATGEAPPLPAPVLAIDEWIFADALEWHVHGGPTRVSAPTQDMLTQTRACHLLTNGAVACPRTSADVGMGAVKRLAHADESMAPDAVDAAIDAALTGDDNDANFAGNLDLPRWAPLLANGHPGARIN